MDEMLFVCTGNTCRSPLAEQLFLLHNGNTRLSLCAASAGIFTTDGIPASENAVVAAKELQIEMDAHRTRCLTQALAERATYLVCMTGAQCDELIRLYPQYVSKVRPLANTDIADPFGCDLAHYRFAACHIADAVAQLIQQLEEHK